MKKIMLLFVVLLVFPYLIKASPIISSIEINPTSAWLGEDVFISCECLDDNENYTIDRVYVDISGPNILISDRDLEKDNNTYFLMIEEYVLNERGEYMVDFYCINNNSENATGSGSFSISELTSSIEDISPDPAYIGDEIEIDVDVKKDDVSLSSGINFTVSLNQEEKTLKQYPLYHTEKGWVLKIDAPMSTGTYDLDILVGYDRTETSDTSVLEIKQPLQFELVSIDKTWVKPKDNITIVFTESYKGGVMDLKEEYLNFWIDGVDCEIRDISRTGDYFYVKITTPNLSPGTYDFKIRFTYMDFVKDISETINYVVPVSGTIKDSKDESVYAQLKFKNSDTEKTFITDNGGTYSGNLPPGIYDLEVKFSNSNLLLTDILINEFDDPIRYDHTTEEVEIEGIGVGGVFVYEIALTFSEAHIEMKYQDNKILDESKISIYKCENWNFGRRICNTDWEEINGEVDTVRNLAKVNVTSLSTFVVGYKKDMSVDFNTDKEEYQLDDIIKILGVTEDDDKKPISNVKIKASVTGTSITSSTTSDNSGVFSLEFQGPNKEGNYTLSVEAEKSPYSGTNKTSEIKVFKSKKLSILLSESVKIKQGEKKSIEVSIVNLGQTDFYELSMSLINIPEEYYILSETELDRINAGEEKKVMINLIIPHNAMITSYTGKFKVDYDSDSLEEQFLLSIIAGEQNVTENVTEPTPGSRFPSISLPTANIVLPSMGNVLWVFLIGIPSFSISFWLKKRKGKVVTEREDVKNLLLDIKREINRKPMKRKTRHVKKSKKKGKSRKN